VEKLYQKASDLDLDDEKVGLVTLRAGREVERVTRQGSRRDVEPPMSGDDSLDALISTSLAMPTKTSTPRPKSMKRINGRSSARASPQLPADGDVFYSPKLYLGVSGHRHVRYSLYTVN
jgi:hypothetical protein